MLGTWHRVMDKGVVVGEYSQFFKTLVAYQQDKHVC